MFAQNVSKVSIIKRSKEIALVLVKYGFQNEAAKVFIQRRIGPRKEKNDYSKLSANRRLRLAIQELGPTFIKLGQIMSTRPDLLSPELITELKMLTDDVEAIPWEKVAPVVEHYCGPIDETFVFLDRKPLASASVSQVYFGKLKDGAPVVLKVQRPGIRDSIAVDLQIVKMIEKKAKSVPELQIFCLPELIADFSRQITSELDFTKEGRNADILAENMRSTSGIRIPKIYWQYSGQRLLVMEYIKGVRIDKVEQIKKMGVDTKKIVLLGLEAYWKQIFDDGFFHGDPHPGNLLVTSKGELVFLDFGIVGVLRREKRDFLLRYFLALIERDMNMLVEALGSYGLVVEESQEDAFKDDMYLALIQNESMTMKPDVKVLHDIAVVFRKYNLAIPPTTMLMVKIFSMVQETSSKLYPEFVLLKETSPLIEQSLNRRIQEEADVHRVGVEMLGRYESLKELPKNVDRVLKHLSTGSFTVKIPDEDLEKLGEIADTTSYRLLLGLVFASIVIGTSIIVLATQSMLAAQPIMIAVLVFAIAILIVVASEVQLVRSRNKLRTHGA